MDSDQQQQKGLFTFYRQQADLQDELKSQKRILKETKLDKIQESQKKILNHAHKMKNGPKKNLHSLSGDNQSVQSFQKGVKDARQKRSQAKDKLITILRKYNVKQLKRRDHLRIIMEMQEEPSLDQAEQLKNRLQKLLSDERDDYFKLIQSQRIANYQSYKQQQFTKKREEVQRVNPFHRLAIIPTNFTTQLQQQKDYKLPLKKVHSPPKSLIYSLQVRKNDRIQPNMHPRQRYQGKISQMLVNQPLKLLVPKIEARSNSQMINKSKIRPSKLGEKYYIDPIRSQRFKNKSQLSIFLQSIQPVNQGKNYQHLQNKIHSLFIENKDGKRIQEAKSTDKEIRLADVIKRMNFS